MKPNEFLTLIEGYWKEKLTTDNRRIYRKALARFKPDDLSRISIALVESCVFFPKVSDVLRVARENLSIEEEPEERPRGCTKCQGTTWVPVTLKHPHTGITYDAVTSCDCTPREPPQPKAKPPKAKQRELLPVANVSIDEYPD